MSTQSHNTSMDGGDETIALDDDGNVRLPVVELLTGRGFITGKSGSGKSNSASVIAEELLSEGYPLLIVDTDGEYYGLKEEYEMLHVGADEECDLQVGPEHGEKLAELALEQNVPIILDVSGYLDEGTANDLIRETAHALFTKEKKLKRPFLLLVEEVHEYIPEGGGLDDVGQMLVKIGKRGRKHGLGLVGISQRPADVKKDFITQANWMLWHRLTWDNDTKVVRRVVDAETADAVQDLDDGEGFLMADWSETDIQRVQVRRKHTFDAGATPDLGEFERPELKSVSGDLVDELEEISARQDRRQDHIEQLEARIEELQDEKADLQQQLENQEDIASAAQQMAEALSSADNGGGPTPEVIEEKNARIADLEEENDQLRDRVETLEAEAEEIQAELRKRPDISERALEAVDVLAEEFGVTDGDGKWKQKYEQAKTRIEELESQRNRNQSLETDPLENRRVKRYLTGLEDTLSSLSDTKREMLRYYVVNGEAEASEAYKYAGNSPTSSRRTQYSKQLVSDGLLANDSDETYRYALRETVCEEFGNHFDDDEVQEIVDAAEDLVDKHVMGDSA